MKKSDDIKRAFDAIQPTEEQKQRMLNNVLSQSDNNITKFDFRKLLKPKSIAAAFIIIVFAAGSVFAINNLPNTSLQKTVAEGEKTITQGDKANDNAFPANDSFREDMIAPITNQFKVGNKTYILLSDDYKENVNFPKTVTDSDIGEKITTIKSNVDPSLNGFDVYAYKPAGCHAVVAVKLQSEYKLFKFLSFDSYNNNQDEDTAVYLDLYGIKSASDILKIQFVGYSEQAKINRTVDIKAEITDRADIAKFYNFYSVIKNSSDKYFDKLFNFRNDVSQNAVVDPTPPDYIEGGGPDQAVTDIAEPQYAQDSIGGNQAYITPQREPSAPIIDYGETSASGSGATNALANSVTIRIFNQSGVYFDAEYYPNLGFISRHEVNNEFAEFIDDILNS